MGNTYVSPEARKELVTKKAFELYVKRGSKAGHELDDWLEAERLVDKDLKEKTQTTTSAKTEPAPVARPSSAPTPIRNTTSKVGYKRVKG